MKPIFALFILICSLLLVANLSHARKDLGDYWKNTMNGQPMPEAIKELVVQADPQVSGTGNKDRFIRDFDIKPNIILYHTHLMSEQKQNQKLKPSFGKDFEPVLSQGTGTHG